MPGFAFAIGIAIGYFVARWEYRKWIKRLEFEAKKEQRFKEIVSQTYANHLDSHTCKYVGKEDEWPDYVSIGDDQC